MDVTRGRYRFIKRSVACLHVLPYFDIGTMDVTYAMTWFVHWSTFQISKSSLRAYLRWNVWLNGLTVSKDLQIEQSFEDLEGIFEPGDPFTYGAIVQRHHLQ
ncbi:hypothetical protein HAX54_037712 [Datura stramonium]|uniref:Uncharacterized protein n=1 Tax=Datura stramonium TaxID=4076 RepID=A0ABS8VJH5_DATST|nr:hypothetical protein [Datura stramonium]